MNAIPPADQLSDSKGRARRGGGEAVRLTPEGLGEVGPAPDALEAEGRGRAAAASGGQAAPSGGAVVPPHLAAVEVTLSVEVGRRQLPLGELVSVEPGQLFELDRLTDEPVRVLVNGTPFARGEVVAIGDRFGIRLTAIEGQADTA